jgi:hypothetical protein
MLDAGVVGRAGATRVTARTRRCGTSFDPGAALTAGAEGMSARSLYVTVGVGEDDRGSVNPITGVR